MISEVSMLSEINGGAMIRERDSGGGGGERESLYRSGSAPPTVEGSLSAVGGLFATEEELRADPAYANYYYSNLNLNPRLPPPLVSKEDWRYSQRRHAASLFSVQPGVKDSPEDPDDDAGDGDADAWGSGGDGLIGLTGLGLAARRKTISEILQDDMIQAKAVSRQPSRPASRNAFDDSIENSETQFAHLHHDLSSRDALPPGGNKQGMSAHNIGGSASHSYASALSASLSRSTTPDPQLIARAPSPRIPTAGGRANPIDRRSVNGQNSFNGVSHKLSESEDLVATQDLVAALSGMNLSTGSMIDEEKHVRSQIQHELDNRHKIFNSQNDQNHIKQNSYLNKSDSGHGHFRGHSFSQSTKAAYQSMGKSSGVGMDSPTLNGRGGSSSHFHNIDSSNSSFPNYNLSVYGVSPPSPSMMGSPMGGANLPPLYENAAASAMGGIDSRAFGGGLALGPSMLAVATELQNAGRLGNHTGGSLQVPLVDPLYLQYLRTNEYAAAAAQAAALNEATMDREGLGNAYMDLYGLQKAYLGSLLSSQKSQFGVPYMGKSSSLNHGYYENPAYSLGMSYPGSPLGGPLLPNSPVGSGSPVRHSERNLRFSSGMRNMTGLMGGWHSEAGGKLDDSFPSSLLDEFKSNKTKCFELAEIAGHVVEFSADQYGSRFIQQKLETATVEEKNMVFNEIMPQGLSLMTDVFGNYVIQKFFEHGTGMQIRELADLLTGHVLTLSLQMYGCRVIQKAIEVVDLDQQTKMVMELDGQIMRCVRDQNGNHVIQKCIECVPEDAIQFIISTFYDQVVTLSTHPYGCRVIQRVLEHCREPKTQQIMMDEILQSVCMLAQDQYGNYVVQHVLEHGKPHERTSIIKKLTGQIVQMSQQKFASNVVEKCLSFGTPVERQTLVNEMLGSTDENEPLQAMMKDQFANYVVQKVLETCDDQQLELILTRIKVHLNALKKYTYGKHIVARVEKLVAAGERRISILTPQPHAA